MYHQHRLTTIIILSFGLALILLISLFTMLQTSQAATGVFCVVPSGASTGPFAACDQVFTNVQTAVNTSTTGEKIWVAGGVYTDVHFTGTMTQVVYIDKAITLQGGFVPPFETPPDPESNPTVLDAQRQGRVIVVTGTTAIIDGFHITGGNGDQDTRFPTSGAGGGIYATNATLTVKHNSIYDNIGSRFDGAGGGMMVNDSQFIISNNDIFSNTAVTSPHPNFPNDYYLGFGGGVEIDGSQGLLHKNTIRNNIANAYQGGNGGGINLSGSNHVTITHNIIAENVGSRSYLGNGGGLSWFYEVHDDGPLPKGTFAHNLISGNMGQEFNGYMAGTGGGVALSINTGLPQVEPLISLISNDVISNTAVFSPTSGGGGIGGGVWLSGNSRYNLSHNRILSNTATAKSGDHTWGNGGGLVILSALVTLDGDRIQYNQLGSDGTATGVIMDSSVVTMTNVVVTDNQHPTVGEGININNSQVTMLHPTIAGNGARGIWITYYDEAPHNPDTTSQVVITNAILSGHTTGIVISRTNTATINGVLWHDTNTAVSYEPGAIVSINNEHVGNPHFDSDGYHLTTDSAAISQGVLSEVNKDIDGDGRPFPPALGADEYLPFKHFLPLVLQE